MNYNHMDPYSFMPTQMPNLTNEQNFLYSFEDQNMRFAQSCHICGGQHSYETCMHTYENPWHENQPNVYPYYSTTIDESYNQNTYWSNSTPINEYQNPSYYEQAYPPFYPNEESLQTHDIEREQLHQLLQVALAQQVALDNLQLQVNQLASLVQPSLKDTGTLGAEPMPRMKENLVEINISRVEKMEDCFIKVEDDCEDNTIKENDHKVECINKNVLEEEMKDVEEFKCKEIVSEISITKESSENIVVNVDEIKIEDIIEGYMTNKLVVDVVDELNMDICDCINEVHNSEDPLIIDECNYININDQQSEKVNDIFEEKFIDFMEGPLEVIDFICIPFKKDEISLLKKALEPMNSLVWSHSWVVSFQKHIMLKHFRNLMDSKSYYIHYLKIFIKRAKIFIKLFDPGGFYFPLLGFSVIQV